MLKGGWNGLLSSTLTARMVRPAARNVDLPAFTKSHAVSVFFCSSDSGALASSLEWAPFGAGKKVACRSTAEKLSNLSSFA